MHFILKRNGCRALQCILEKFNKHILCVILRATKQANRHSVKTGTQRLSCLIHVLKFQFEINSSFWWPMYGSAAAAAVVAVAVAAPQIEIRKWMGCVFMYMAGFHCLVYRKRYWMACSVPKAHYTLRSMFVYVHRSEWTIARNHTHINTPNI